MHLHVLADLHLEFGATKIPAPEADVVVLAGDIHGRAVQAAVCKTAKAGAIRAWDSNLVDS